jgi:type IV pilus assembly protein PilM
MLGWAKRSCLPIGVDIGTRSIKLLQLRQRRGQLVLQAAARAEIPPCDAGPERTAAVTAILRKLTASGGFVGKCCVSSLPARQLQSRSIRLPQMPDNERARAVLFEARERFNFDLEQGCIEHFVAGEARRGTEVRDELLLFAASSDTLRWHIDGFVAAGLELEAIDLQPCALQRALARVLPPAPGALQALIDIGAGGTQLLMIQDDRLVFYKHIEIGADTFTQAAAQKLGVGLPEAERMLIRVARGDGDDTSPQLAQAVIDATRPAVEDLARELDMCLRYYVVTFRGKRPEHAYLVGGHAASVRISEAIGQTIGAQLLNAAPLATVVQDTPLIEPVQAGQWAAAMGLALYSLRAHQGVAA